ncbi:MAG: hypothetical protein ABI791_08985 [Acidobacteriota bacterium]
MTNSIRQYAISEWRSAPNASTRVPIPVIAVFFPKSITALRFIKTTRCIRQILGLNIDMCGNEYNVELVGDIATIVHFEPEIRIYKILHVTMLVEPVNDSWLNSRTERHGKERKQQHARQKGELDQFCAVNFPLLGRNNCKPPENGKDAKKQKCETCNRNQPAGKASQNIVQYPRLPKRERHKRQDNERKGNRK